MYVVSISVKERKQEVPEVQDLLTKYGDQISVRLGVHGCSDEHVGLLLVIYKEEAIEEFIEELKSIGGVLVNYMKV
jgi:metal-responsive CopG/Arc/MetJ family transcriptional regulator